MLSRNEAVSVVLSFYDRLDELKNRNVRLVETVEGLKSAARERFLHNPTPLWRFGRKKHLCDDCVRSFRQWFTDVR